MSLKHKFSHIASIIKSNVISHIWSKFTSLGFSNIKLQDTAYFPLLISVLILSMISYFHLGQISHQHTFLIVVVNKRPTSKTCFKMFICINRPTRKKVDFVIRRPVLVSGCSFVLEGLYDHNYFKIFICIKRPTYHTCFKMFICI